MGMMDFENEVTPTHVQNVMLLLTTTKWDHVRIIGKKNK